MAPKTIFAVPGTWEIGPGNYPNTPIGMMKKLTDLLNRSVFDVQHVNYPARFGPIAANGEPPLSQLGSPSYAQSVQMGVDEVIRLIKLMPAGRKFGVVGYSQGGAVASRVGEALLTDPTLAGRKNDCFWIHTFASPHRAQGRTFHQGNTLAGRGISGQPIGGFGAPGLPATLDWFDYCLPDDMYGNAIEDSYLVAGYEVVKDMSLIDPVAWAAAVGTAITNGEVAEAMTDLNTDPLTFARKVYNTVDALNRFTSSGVHGRYAIDQIIPGKTAIAHSANHLNYWGPRR
ncbi:PE-PPE domain-containing protein [Gordonia sp. CPCC 205333]|uniref:PE-PPE domain-containing protein n=1 Tax=Gordonia sp. CPCC 205333 TaxID=3140790 RepID=UPI003AF3C3F0